LLRFDRECNAVDIQVDCNQSAYKRGTFSSSGLVTTQ